MHNKIDEKKKKLLFKVAIVTSILFLLLAIFLFGRSYAYFSAAISESNPENQQVAISTSNVTVEYDAGNGAIRAGGINPGWSESKTFKVTNHNVVTEYYSIVWKEVMNTFENNTDIVYSLTGPINKEETIAPLGDGAILVDIEIPAGAVQEYTLKISYKNKGQEPEIDALFSAFVKVTKNGEELRNDGIANQEAIVDLIYPVGSIYITTNSHNPSDHLGVGTWEAWGSGQVLTGVDTALAEFNTVEKTGGSTSTSHTHTVTVNNSSVLTSGSTSLTINQLPSHDHNVRVWATGYSGFPLQTTTGYLTDYNSYVNPDGSSKYLNSQLVPVGKTESTGTGAGHTHTIPAHSHTATNSNVQVSTLQPYITAYMWKRVS